jgi:hypothetical protein
LFKEVNAPFQHVRHLGQHDREFGQQLVQRAPDQWGDELAERFISGFVGAMPLSQVRSLIASCGAMNGAK